LQLGLYDGKGSIGRKIILGINFDMPERMGLTNDIYTVLPHEEIYATDGTRIVGVVKVGGEWPEKNLMLLQLVDEPSEGAKKLEVKRSDFFGTSVEEP
jgi:hypothetical protein